MNQSSRPRNSKSAPPGLERKILGKLPHVLLAGTLLPILFYWYLSTYPNPRAGVELAQYTTGVLITAVAVMTLVWTSVITLGIGCFIVIVMKGPGYVADGYELPDSDKPVNDTEASSSEKTDNKAEKRE